MVIHRLPFDSLPPPIAPIPLVKTLTGLKAKHEPLSQLSDTETGHLEVSRKAVLVSIHAFSPDSAAGVDCIKSMRFQQLVAKKHS